MTVMNTSGIDTSSDYDKLNRIQINKLLDHHGIQHPPFCKKTVGIKLLEANDINPRDGIEWEVIYVNNEQGQPVPKEIPKVTEPKRPDNWAEMKAQQLDEAISKKAIEDKDNEINNLKSQLADLTNLVKQMAEGKVKKNVTRETTKETDPLKMKFMAQKKWLKEYGIELKKGDNAKELIQKVLDEQNAT